MRILIRTSTNLCCAIIACFLVSSAQAKYGGGGGTAQDPYSIYTAEQMNAIGAEPNDWDKHFKLMADIDLSQFTGAEFNIIGTAADPFTGYFNGNFICHFYRFRQTIRGCGFNYWKQKHNGSKRIDF